MRFIYNSAGVSTFWDIPGHSYKNSSNCWMYSRPTVSGAEIMFLLTQNQHFNCAQI